MSRIRLTIDELALKGFAPGERKALVDGLQGELARALADPAAGIASGRSRRTPVLRLGQKRIDPSTRGSRTFGTGLARDVVKGLKP
jgi:hypothetical protein